jgi:hypothetical protein
MLADRLVLHVFGDGVELAARSAAGLIRVSRLSVPPPPAAADAEASGAWLDGLAHELRRAAYTPLGTGPADEAREVLVWDEATPGAGLWDALAQRLGVPVRLCTSEAARRPARAAPPTGSGQYSAAAAMALAGLKGHRLPVDFVHSRLAVRQGPVLGRRIAWAAGVVAALLVAGGVLVADVIRTERDVADLEALKADSQEAVTAAEQLVDRTTFARGWYDQGRPPVLDCLRAITERFPAEGGIYVTVLRLDEALVGNVSGKAARESMVLGVLDRLKASRSFAEVNLLYMREAGRVTRETAFAIGFRYTGEAGGS